MNHKAHSHRVQVKLSDQAPWFFFTVEELLKGESRDHAVTGDTAHVWNYLMSIMSGHNASDLRDVEVFTVE